MKPGSMPGQPASVPDSVAGFTLIEIIVVVLVFSILSVMAYGGLRSVLDIRRGIETSMERTAELQRAFLRLRGDFQNLRDRPARDAFGDAQPPVTIDGEGILTVIRGGWRNPAQSARSSLERIRYRVKDGFLWRATWKVVDLPQEGEPTDLRLLSKVDELRWRFLGPDAEWHEQWPPDASGSLAPGSGKLSPPPLAVEVTAVTRDFGELRFVFTTPRSGIELGGDVASGGALSTKEGLLSVDNLPKPSQLQSSQSTPQIRNDGDGERQRSPSYTANEDVSSTSDANPAAQLE